VWLIPSAAVFVAAALFDQGFTFKANMAGLLVGLAGGLALTGGISNGVPPARRVLLTAAVALVAIAARLVPMRGITDVRPDISRIIALEDRTTGVYQTALERFRKGSISAEALATFIDRTIVPELEAADLHLKSIRGVPPEQHRLVADAEEYLRLRSASWRFYAEGWRSATRVPRMEQPDGVALSNANWRMQVAAQFRANAATRGKAEGTQTASLEALRRITPPGE
jgi:hypothetical protein